MASLKEIALECGVSIATVSKALNDHGDISVGTKEKIRQVAKHMGYFSNAQAQALKTNKTNNIGVLFVDESRSGLTHDYFSEVLDWFKRAVEERGYDITFINADRNGRKGKTLLEHCKYRGFDGVMIACVDFEEPEVIELVNSDIPLVTIDHVFNNRIAIMSDNINGMRDLVTYAYEMGHRRIAYIYGNENSVTRDRLTSFYAVAEEFGVEIQEGYVRKAAYRSTTAAKFETEKLLEMENKPTCIIYPDDFACFGGMNAILERGMKIPEDISIIGYDGIKLGRRMSPRLTTLRQDTKEIGEAAGESLISLIERPKTTFIEQRLIQGSLYEGETVKKI